MPLVEGRPPQFTVEDLARHELLAERGRKLVAYLETLDPTGPPPPYYEGTPEGNIKKILEQHKTTETEQKDA